MPTLEEIREQAKMLAEENRRAEPTIQHVYWFPSLDEIRLVELTPIVPPSGERLEPFYFRAAPDEGIYASSGIAMIRPEEFKRLRLPNGWASWDEAEELLADNGDLHE